MFCSNCGVKASGHFCSCCGAKLAPAGHGFVAVQDWSDEVRYAALLDIPEVREKLAHYASQAKKAISGEQFLEVCDAAFSPVPGVSLTAVAKIAAPIYARMGIRTGKTRNALISRPTGKVLVSALCSLARFGRAIKQVHQGDDGCLIEAALPSDLWSFEGELLISLWRHPGGTKVEAATKIPGQLYDWGKSQRCLNQLFEDLEAL